MELDAAKLPNATRLDADLCIVGAGPAGLALAGALLGLDADILVVESGGPRWDEAVQVLNDGIMYGEPSLDLRQSRYRGAAGTARRWNTRVDGDLGAKFAPLDRWDFEERSDLPLTGWPFDHDHLEPFYRRAQAVAGLGPYAYEGEQWSDPERRCLVLPSDRLTTRVYQLGGGLQFTDRNLRALRAAGNVRLCYHATVCALETTASRTRVVGAKVGRLSGGSLSIRARLFVLAAGAIENARLLLLSGGTGPDGLGNRHGWVGRCFMEHPRDHAMSLTPRSAELFRRLAFYDSHAARDGTTVRGRLALAPGFARATRVPNASLTFQPRLRRKPSPPGPVARLLARLGGTDLWAAQGGPGWSRLREPERLFDGFRLILNLEQRPSPDNHIGLAPGVDALGAPRAELRWRWREEEQAGLDQLRKTIAYALEEAGLGRVTIAAGARLDPHAHHHAGTTRMHPDPRYGAVDPDGRVHGTDNLYLAGASVFPTAGFANPTLTIVALALRLADHLQRRGL